MAEIKSTLDLVMERAARIGAASKADLEEDERNKAGMRLAAGYLKGDPASLEIAQAESQGPAATAFRNGFVTVLLRNIVLPHENSNQQAEKAMQGLLEFGRSSSELLAVFRDIKQILDQYVQHRQDLHHQLEEALRQQLEQAMAQQTGKAALGMKIDPKRHPKFAEEWQRVQAELSGQYGRALEQQKKYLANYFNG